MINLYKGVRFFASLDGNYKNSHKIKDLEHISCLEIEYYCYDCKKIILIPDEDLILKQKRHKYDEEYIYYICCNNECGNNIRKKYNIIL